MSDESESALTFPCDFPIKAMGLAIHDLEMVVGEIIREHAPDTTEEAFSSRANGKYVSITVVVNAQSRDQLDAIYQALTDHEYVIMAL